MTKYVDNSSNINDSLRIVCEECKVFVDSVTAAKNHIASTLFKGTANPNCIGWLEIIKEVERITSVEQADKEKLLSDNKALNILVLNLRQELSEVKNKLWLAEDRELKLKERLGTISSTYISEVRDKISKLLGATTILFSWDEIIEQIGNLKERLRIAEIDSAVLRKNFHETVDKLTDELSKLRQTELELKNRISDLNRTNLGHDKYAKQVEKERSDALERVKSLVAERDTLHNENNRLKSNYNKMLLEWGGFKNKLRSLEEIIDNVIR